MLVNVTQQLTNVSVAQDNKSVTVSLPAIVTNGSSETAASIKTKYESNANTNAFTDAEKSAIAANTLKQGVTTEEANPDVISRVEAEAGTATTERTWTAERVKQAIEALASSSPEILDTLFRIVDSVSGYKQIFDTDELSADSTLTLFDGDLDLNDYFDGSGGLHTMSSSNAGLVYFGSDGKTFIQRISNRLYIGADGDLKIVIGSVSESRLADYDITWSASTSNPLSANDVGIGRLDTGKLGITTGTRGTRGELDLKFPEYTTAERTTLPNTANTTVYDTDLNKLFTNDGTTWNAHWT